MVGKKTFKYYTPYTPVMLVSHNQQGLKSIKPPRLHRLFHDKHLLPFDYPYNQTCMVIKIRYYPTLKINTK